MKKVLLGLLVIVVLLIAGFFIYAKSLDTKVLVEESLIINKNNQAVFDFIKHFKNQQKYSVWKEMDPTTKNEFTGVDGELGAKHIWESEQEQVGYGSMELTKIEPGKRLEWSLKFTQPFEAQSTPYMITEFIDSNTTKVIWGCDMAIPVPFNIFLKSESKKLGQQFSASLTKLKSILEN